MKKRKKLKKGKGVIYTNHEENSSIKQTGKPQLVLLVTLMLNAFYS